MDTPNCGYAKLRIRQTADTPNCGYAKQNNSGTRALYYIIYVKLGQVSHALVNLRALQFSWSRFFYFNNTMLLKT